MKLLAFRTRRRAELWLFDPFGVLYALSLLLAFGTPIPGWLIGAGLVMLSLRFTRLRVLAHDPSIVRAITYWFIVPIWWKRVSLGSIRTGSMDEWTDEKDNTLEIGGREHYCPDPSRWLAWLRESTLPSARVVR